MLNGCINPLIKMFISYGVVPFLSLSAAKRVVNCCVMLHLSWLLVSWCLYYGGIHTGNIIHRCFNQDIQDSLVWGACILGKRMKMMGNAAVRILHTRNRCCFVKLRARMGVGQEMLGNISKIHQVAGFFFGSPKRPFQHKKHLNFSWWSSSFV